MPIDELNEGETVQDKTVTESCGEISEAQVLPWANVPLFKPAVAVLTCAVIAVGVLALVSPLRERSAEFAVDKPKVQFERLTLRPEFLAIAPRPVDKETSAPSVFANSTVTRRSDAEPATTELRFTKQKVAIYNRFFGARPTGFAEKFAEVSFEYPNNVSLAATSSAVFNSSTVFESAAGSYGFLPPPTKPRLVKNSAATVAILLPLPKPALKPSLSGVMSTVAALDAHFDRLDYDLADIDIREPGSHVPRVYLEKLPEDIAEETSVTLRKRVFIKTILPVVLRVNEDILATRKKLQKLRDILDSGVSLTDEQRDWLYQMANRYETNPYDWDVFMARVDIVPPSLAIAQAAEESGWGTSRFAREGNALFGQYTFSASNGMLPEARANGRRHLIRVYENLIEGVRSYIHNLNYHLAYKEFRAARKWLRNHDNPIDGHTLAGELIRYSERGIAYVKTLRRIMHVNELLPLDHARLHEDRWTRYNTTRNDWQS